MTRSRLHKHFAWRVETISSFGRSFWSILRNLEYLIERYTPTTRDFVPCSGQKRCEEILRSLICGFPLSWGPLKRNTYRTVSPLLSDTPTMRDFVRCSGKQRRAEVPCLPLSLFVRSLKRTYLLYCGPASCDLHGFFFVFWSPGNYRTYPPPRNRFLATTGNKLRISEKIPKRASHFR